MVKTKKKSYDNAVSHVQILFFFCLFLIRFLDSSKCIWINAWRLSDFKMDFAEVRQITANSKRAHAVEVCDCPRGYAGHSCEICAPGYKSVRRGFYLGLCEPLWNRTAKTERERQLQQTILIVNFFYQQKLQVFYLSTTKSTKIITLFTPEEKVIYLSVCWFFFTLISIFLVKIF